MDRILSRLPIGLKLGGSFFIIVLIITLSLVSSYSDLGNLNRGMMSMYFDHTIPIQNLGEVKALLGQIKSNVQIYLQIPEPKTVSTVSNQRNTPCPGWRDGQRHHPLCELSCCAG